MSSEQTGTTQASTPIVELHRSAMEQQRKADNALLKETLALSSETCNKLIEEQTKLISDLKEQELKFTSDLKKETTSATEKAVAALGEKIREITVAYRQVMEKETDEVRKTAAALTKALETEPAAKKEIAETLRTCIDKTAEDLTEYYKKELEDSIASLNVSLKKAGGDIEDLCRKTGRSGMLSRVMNVATPVLLAATLCVSIAALAI